MALVCRYPPFVYIHPYCCGGNSIRKALADHPVKPFETEEYLGWHSDLASTVILFALNEELPLLRQMTIFSFIRNPFDWNVSLYHYIKRAKAHGLHAIAEAKAFPEWIDWYVHGPLQDETHWAKNKYLTLNQFLSCAHLPDLQKQLFIGRLESFDEDWKKLLKKMGFVSDIQLPHVNKNTNRHPGYRQYYNPEARRLVEEYFRVDFERFGYDW